MSKNIDLFAAIEDCLPEEQALLAALLDNGHLGKILGPQIVKIAGPVLDLFNITIPKVSFEQLLEASKKEFLKKSPAERINSIKDEVASRCGYNGPKDSILVTYLVLQMVAGRYKIDQWLLPRDLAYQIMTRFFEKMEQEYKKAWERADSNKRREIDEAINQQISQLTESERKTIQAALKLDDLSASTVRNVIFTTSPTMLLSTIVGASGFGAYIALSVIVHTVFTSVLGITLPFGIYMGLSSALAAVTGPLAPIFIGGGMIFAWLKSGKKLNVDLLEMVTGMGLTRMFLSGNLNPTDVKLLPHGTESAKGELEDARKLIEGYRSRIYESQREIQEKHSEIKALEESITHEAESVKRSLARIEAVKNDISQAGTSTEPVQNEISNESLEISELEKARKEREIALQLAEEEEKKRIQAEKEIAENKTKMEKLAAEIKEIERELNRYQYYYNGVRRKRKEEYRYRYSSIYKNLLISDRVYEWLAENPDYHVTTSAEAAFLELNNGNFVLHDRGKIADTQYFHNSFGPKDAYRIYYCKSNNRIYIADIGHKNIQDENIAWLKSHPTAGEMMQ